MPRISSPALGCQLRSVEVQVGENVETYDASTFNQPLELSLEGQRPLGSEVGILLLVITSGSKQMLSIRLNDLLKHSNGTEQTISIDKKTHKLLVRLPTLDHTLRVWFQHSRDFLVSACILTKAGFTVEEEVSPERTNNATRGPSLIAEANNKADPPRLTSITSLAALTKQARVCQAQHSKVMGNRTTDGNIFDEVLDHLRKIDRKPALSDFGNSGSATQPSDSTNLSILHPCNVLAPHRKFILTQPRIGSPLRSVSTSEPSEESFNRQSVLGSRKGSSTVRQPSQLRHSYFTRSSSTAARQSGKTRRDEGISHMSDIRAESNRPLSSGRPRDQSLAFSGTVDSNPTLDFRSLMPHPRSLPFLESRQLSHKRLKASADPVLCAQRASEIRLSNARLIDRAQDMPVLIVQPYVLDELEVKTSHIFAQYEQDIAEHGEDERRAGFYLDQLDKTRIDFWLSELEKANSAEHDIDVDE